MGWTWVLCGLASAIGWLTLPVDAAEMTTFVVWPAAIMITIVHLLRLRRPRKDESRSRTQRFIARLALHSTHRGAWQTALEPRAAARLASRALRQPCRTLGQPEWGSPSS
jgi:hypothetical protein